VFVLPALFKQSNDLLSCMLDCKLGGDVEASGYLYTIAAVGMSFAGLSVLTMILRQILGGQMTKFDSFVARSWVQLGFMITFGSILPPLLGLVEVSTLMIWRISSALMAIILGCWALTFPRRRLATNSTRLPIPVIMFLAAMDLVALALAANAIAVPVERLPGVYAVSVTAILIGAAMLFLFAFVHWYDAPSARAFH
jgi:hypothetical protein